jgi:hypothetical protein
LFGALVPKLLARAQETGCGVKLGEVLRSPVQAFINATAPVDRARMASLLEHDFDGLARLLREIRGTPGTITSLHIQGLAIDLMLFRGEQWLFHGDEPEYLTLGEFWEKSHELCRWGGRFTKPDPGHFSVTVDARRA